MVNKINILFIQPLFYDPTLPNFKDRFEMLSEKCCGHIISVSGGKLNDLHLGEFLYHPLPFIKNKLLRNTYYLYKIVSMGVKINKSKKIDYVHSYDPLIFGICAALIRLFTNAKVIIEINGHLKEAGFIADKSVVSKLKKLFFTLVAGISLKSASKVKLLNKKQREEWSRLLEDKEVEIFHDFVPTHVFDSKKSRDNKYILFLGYPFYVKGVDILIKAFIKISKKFPDFSLKIIGYCPGGHSEKEIYIKMSEDNKRIEVLDPVFYNEAIDLIQNCTFLVLPSRTEAMGRVLIEAMAAGKPVIGSRVGGIPDIIDDQFNGFLFDNCDVNDLANKMSLMLSDEKMRIMMGVNGHRLVQDRFSSKEYASHFFSMVETI